MRVFLVGVAVLLAVVSCFAGVRSEEGVFSVVKIGTNVLSVSGENLKLNGASFVPSSACSYPVLRLALGGRWTDFELKATTNNFVSLVYFVKSYAVASEAKDTNVWTYFTDDYAVDVRKWVRATNAAPILNQLSNVLSSKVDYVVVCPSHNTGTNWTTWMSSTNNRLVWSYVRCDGVTAKTNASGTKQRWNAVVPTEWRTGRLQP